MPELGDVFYWAVLVGFVAQSIDGALGMAYGVTSTSFLLFLGISPASASASVHTAEIFSTAASGIAHWRQKNVDWNLFWKLALFGAVGGAVGAYVLASSIDGGKFAPWVSLYLLILGVRIIVKAIRKTPAMGLPKKDGRAFYGVLGFFGGIFDALGGGGWGPIVTTTLLNREHEPHRVIGSVNAAECVVTIVQATTFFFVLGIAHLDIILGIVLGSIPAAFFGAWACRRIPPKTLMVMVGLLIIFLSGNKLIPIVF